MSHQTGIKASDNLKQKFAASKDGSIRFMKVIIENEKMELACSEGPQQSWEDDYVTFVLPNICQKEACYMLFRFDSSSNPQDGFDWLLINYTPDNALVRHKMLYAATKATLKQEFGAGHIKDELSGTEKDDVSLQGYRNHLEAKKAPAPLTMAEEELEEIKRNEIRTVGVDDKHQTVQGLTFPFEEAALQQLQQMAAGHLNFVQLKLELSQEEVHLANSGNVSPAELASQIPEKNGSYSLYRFDHSHEGDYLRLFVFLYCMPGSRCPVKEKMLYSSCKAPILDVIEQQIGIEIERKLQIDFPGEVTEKFLYDEVHPQKDIVRQKFSRPKGPAGRGPKRMTKAK